MCRGALHLQLGVEGGPGEESQEVDNMECDTSEDALTPMECQTAPGTGSGKRREGGTRSRWRGDEGVKGSGGGGWDGLGKNLITPGTPATPTPSPPPLSPASYLSLGEGSWEGEVADVAALMAGLGAHAACEEAAAAAVAADVHRRLEELAKGCGRKGERVLCARVCSLARVSRNCEVTLCHAQG